MAQQTHLKKGQHGNNPYKNYKVEHESRPKKKKEVQGRY